MDVRKTAIAKKRRTVVIQLAGGLGNQMFQYAAGRAIAHRNSAELVVDTWSGFVRDYQYKRKYELGGFPIHAREATRSERIPFWLDRAGCKLFGRRSGAVSHAWFGDRLYENRQEFMPEIAAHQVARPTYMTGYWQTDRYFDDCSEIIRAELRPQPSQKKHFREMASRMQRENSVAVGIRLYEECKNRVRDASGGIKPLADVCCAARRLVSGQRDVTFFVFCTHRATVLENLQLPGPATHVTPDNGFRSTSDCLWLLTQCRHHIITNSSFYWWGTWLSGARDSYNESLIFAADSFVNKDCVLPNWQRF